MAQRSELPSKYFSPSKALGFGWEFFIIYNYYTFIMLVTSNFECYLNTINVTNGNLYQLCCTWTGQNNPKLVIIGNCFGFSLFLDKVKAGR